MKPTILILMLLVLSLPAPPVFAGEDPARLLPLPSCGPGWPMDGKAAVYDRETLSDHIDGEAELFLPYGFESLAYARYAQGANSFDLDVYRLGSQLDAFGMFASYRPDEADRIATGAEGAVTPTQLFFYQDRYFVRLQSTGHTDPGKAALTACSRAVSRLLPAAGQAPKELALLAIPEVVKESVRYSSTSLLGYDFLPRGMMADALISGEQARVFVVLAESTVDAAKALQSYRSYLQESKGEVRSAGSGAGSALTGIDPLYGRVLFQQTGRYLFGMARVKDAAAALPVMEKLRTNLLK
jgi:hypothetical protein